MSTPDSVRAIVAASGGSIVGKTRLQKSAYLLEATDVGFGFDFSYHYYGPYSEELAIAATDAEALDLIRVRWEEAQTGLPYAVYEAGDSKGVGEDELSARRQEILNTLDRYDSISLELAATAHFLAANGFSQDPWAETRKRKSVKATPERLGRAQRLLGELGIAC